MNSFVGAMIGASILGVLALVLIVADLTRKAHKRTSGRAFLACALGLGVLSVSVKTASLLLLERATHHMHVGASSAWRATGSVGPYNVETSYTAPWQALSPAEDGASDMERAVLGQRLFNERLLSFGGGVSCADCHMSFAAVMTDVQFHSAFKGEKGSAMRRASSMQHSCLVNSGMDAQRRWRRRCEVPFSIRWKWACRTPRQLQTP